MEGLSAAISDAWDRLTKNSSITQPISDVTRKSGRRRQWSQWISYLVTLTHDSTYISIVIDMLFINIKLDMIKWLSLKSPTCISNPSILQSVRNLWIQFQFTWNFARKKCTQNFVALS